MKKTSERELLGLVKQLISVAIIRNMHILVPERELAETFLKLVDGITEGELTSEQLDIIGAFFQNPPPEIYQEVSALKKECAYNRFDTESEVCEGNCFT